MIKEFKEFALKGNAMDLAVGIIIGAAFNGVVKSLVDDMIMPPIGALLSGVDFQQLFFVLEDGKTPGPYRSIAAAAEAGAVTLNYGMFINTLINFVLVAFAVFLMVKFLNHLRPAAEEITTRECPLCLTEVPVGATKCSACTSPLEAAQ